MQKVLDHDDLKKKKKLNNISSFLESIGDINILYFFLITTRTLMYLKMVHNMEQCDFVPK